MWMPKSDYKVEFLRRKDLKVGLREVVREE